MRGRRRRLLVGGFDATRVRELSSADDNANRLARGFPEYVTAYWPALLMCARIQAANSASSTSWAARRHMTVTASSTVYRSE